MVSVNNIDIGLGAQIISRHNTLTKISRVRPEEQESYDSVLILMITSTSCLLIFSLLEMGFYFLFNSKVWNLIFNISVFAKFLIFKFHPWKGLVKDDQEAFTENLNYLKGIKASDETQEDSEDSHGNTSWFSEISLEVTEVRKKVVGFCFIRRLDITEMNRNVWPNQCPKIGYLKIKHEQTVIFWELYLT